MGRFNENKPIYNGKAANNGRAHTTATKMLFTHTSIGTTDKLNPLVTHNYKNKKLYDPVSHFCSILNSDLVVSHNQPKNSFLIKCPY